MVRFVVRSSEIHEGLDPRHPDRVVRHRHNFSSSLRMGVPTARDCQSVSNMAEENNAPHVRFRESGAGEETARAQNNI